MNVYALCMCSVDMLGWLTRYWYRQCDSLKEYGVLKSELLGLL